MVKKILLLSIFCISLVSCGTRASSRQESSPLQQQEHTHRIMSYNIHHGRGMDDKVDIERIGKLIIDVQPEVVGLQEVDSVVNRSGNIDIIQMLSEQTGMHAIFGYSILHDGGKYGNGILTREKPIKVKKIALPGASEARTALVVELERYLIINTHLSLDGEERLQSVKIITDAVKGYDKPVLLIGDLNATPDSAPMEFLKNEWQFLSDPDQPTSPSINPRRTIDYILGYTANGHNYTIQQAEVIDEPVASDHRPLFVDVELGKSFSISTTISVKP